VDGAMRNAEQAGDNGSGRSYIPAISVVIPTYNRLGTLPRALESVLRQTFDDIEIIVVDDLSTDESLAYLESVRDPRLRIIRHETNRGGGAARNTGIKAARAELIAFQDSDDEWLVTKLATQIAEYRRVNSPDYGAIYCAKITSGEGKFGVYGPREVQYMPMPGYEKTSGDISRELIRRAMISTQTLMARRDLLESIGGFDETLKLGQDWDLTTRLSRVTKFLFVDKPLALCFTSPNSISKVKTNQAIARKCMLDKHLDLISEDPALHASYLSEIARVYQRAGCWRQSLPWLTKALRIYPLDRRALPALALGGVRSLFSDKRLDLM
jgi:glycosyltransferase involved in cell wall biosynthesis